MIRRFTLQTGVWPAYGWLGLGLATIFWVLNWSIPGLRTHWGFFPLWLGYCLTVDALVFTRKGNSMLTRSPASYAGLFLISVPAWWLFEVINLRAQNWFYLGEQNFTDIDYFLLSTLSFSTVMPAVFGTAELAGTFNWIKRKKGGLMFKLKPASLFSIFTAGCLMLMLLLTWPDYFFPFVWISLYLIIDPLNVRIGNRSLLRYAADGNWRPIFSLWIGCLICGFFWEMWNFYSYPKWTYRIPFFDFLHVFEMPILGYLGYLPFSMELHALYHLVMGLIKPGGNQDYLQILPDARKGKSL